MRRSKAKRRLLALLLVLALGLLAGCGAEAVSKAEDIPYYGDGLRLVEDAASAVGEIQTGEQERLDEMLSMYGEETPEIAEPEEAAVSEEGEYSSPEEVAAYLHLYGHLPSNFITKNEAKALGWDSSKGNLWEVAPGKSIGGDRFGNYEKLLPEGTYQECDVNYSGGFRGAERLIFGTDGSIYYTNDHYSSFTQLY